MTAIPQFVRYLPARAVALDGIAQFCEANGSPGLVPREVNCAPPRKGWHMCGFIVTFPDGREAALGYEWDAAQQAEAELLLARDLVVRAVILRRRRARR